jgi:D-beta-D-heptose 7-phosphate kinase/D-beta-D-heptose 1-phosphate adenosyltransferase
MGLHHGLRDEYAEEAAEQLKKKTGAGAVLVTLGESGMVACGSETLFVQAPKVEVYDTAGAGDTVIAAVALGIAAAGFRKEVFELAAQAAGSVVRHVGVATPSVSDIEAIRALD